MKRIPATPASRTIVAEEFLPWSNILPVNVPERRRQDGPRSLEGVALEALILAETMTEEKLWGDWRKKLIKLLEGCNLQIVQALLKLIVDCNSTKLRSLCKISMIWNTKCPNPLQNGNGDPQNFPLLQWNTRSLVQCPPEGVGTVLGSR